MMRKRIKNINNFYKNPFNVQKKVFNYLISKGNKTEFGKSHRFDQISNYSNFKSNIPVRTYEEYLVFIKKVRAGGKNIIWPGKVSWFAKSSGTTNDKSKFIPITNESLNDCHFKAGKDMLSLYANNFNDIDIYNGKGLMLGGSLTKSTTKKYQDGDLSAILINEFPFWVNFHRIPDLETALMDNWEDKLERIAVQAINTNITNLTGVPSWMLILLKKVLSISGKKNISEVWPNLELYMHGGVNFDAYKSQFKELIPSEKMNYLEGYNASEGFIAIQDKNPSEGLLLMLDYGIFYEFIPMDKFKKGDKEAIELKSVKINVDYALVISTNAGLWRYLIGDVIRFVCLSPYRLKIIGRTKSFLNAFGEELIVDNTDSALLYVCSKFNVSIKEYTVAPIYIDKLSGRHQWFIEFLMQPKDISIFKKELDNKLKKINSDYAAKRSNNLVLSELEIVNVKKNTFYKWQKNKKRLGGQYKVPRLSNNRKIADELLKLI